MRRGREHIISAHARTSIGRPCVCIGIAIFHVHRAVVDSVSTGTYTSTCICTNTLDWRRALVVVEVLRLTIALVPYDLCDAVKLDANVTYQTGWQRR